MGGGWWFGFGMSGCFRVVRHGTGKAFPVLYFRCCCGLGLELMVGGDPTIDQYDAKRESSFYYSVYRGIGTLFVLFGLVSSGV